MDKESLTNVSPVIDNVVIILEDDKKTLEKAMNDSIIRHDLAQEMKIKIMTLIKAYNKLVQGKNESERAVLTASLLDNIENTITSEVTSMRDRVFHTKGRIEATHACEEKLQNTWSIALADAARVEEVAKMISSGEEPSVGNARKIGARPEKISVVRRAKAIANNQIKEIEAE